MERKRILELALETLETKRAELEAAIEELRGGIRGGITKRPGTPSPAMAKRRSRTAAERKAQSLRMKRIWAEKRAAKAAKDKKRTAKRRPKTVAEKKALSLKMKQAWAKRKADAAKKEKTPSKDATK